MKLFLRSNSRLKHRHRKACCNPESVNVAEAETLLLGCPCRSVLVWILFYVRNQPLDVSVKIILKNSGMDVLLIIAMRIFTLHPACILIA